MPLPHKIALSIIVLLVGTLVAWSEFSGGETWLGWIVLVIMAIMIFGQWVFPEAAKKVDLKSSQPAARPSDGP